MYVRNAIACFEFCTRLCVKSSDGITSPTFCVFIDVLALLVFICFYAFLELSIGFEPVVKKGAGYFGGEVLL